MTIQQPTPKPTPRILAGAIEKRKWRMLNLPDFTWALIKSGTTTRNLIDWETHYGINEHMRATGNETTNTITHTKPDQPLPLGIRGKTLGGNRLLTDFKNNVPLHASYAALTIPIDVAMGIGATANPVLLIALVPLLTLGGGLISATLLGIRERALQKTLQPWARRITADHLRTWLKTHRGIEIHHEYTHRFNYVADTALDSTLTGQRFADTDGHIYRARRNTKTDTFEIVDSAGNDILTDTGWANHKKHGAIPPTRPTKQLLATRTATTTKPNMWHTKPVKPAAPAPASILTRREEQRVHTAGTTLANLMNTDLDIETRHRVGRTADLITELVTNDRRLATITTRAQRAGHSALLETLTIIEAEINDITRNGEQHALKQVRVLAGYARGIRGDKSADPRLIL